MKKVVLCILLCSLIVPMMAQRQRDNTGGRIKVVEKEKERTGDWWNELSISAAFINLSDYQGDSYDKEDEHSIFSLGYTLLKNSGSFYYGPGIHAKLDAANDGDLGFDFFVHGEIQHKSKRTNTDIQFKHIHPMIGASLGLQYVLESSSPKLYFDYNLGFSIDILKFSSIQINYYATLTDGYWQVRRGGWDLGHTLEKGYSLVLCHGVKLSFRF